MKAKDKQEEEFIAKFAEGDVIWEHRLYNGDFAFKTEDQGAFLIRDGVNILKPHQEGKAIDSYSYPNGDFEFETKEQGVVLIRNGENILAPHQDGKASGVYSNDNGDFSFETKEQGEVYITKAEHEAKMRELVDAKALRPSACSEPVSEPQSREWGGTKYPIIARLNHNTFDLIAHPNGAAITDGDYLGTFEVYDDDPPEMLEVKRLAQAAFNSFAWPFVKGEFYPQNAKGS